MKNKKLYAALVAGTLAVSMMGTTVMAASPTGPSGDTNFIYNSGWVGPTDPVAPGDEETDSNNWMVSYPKTIELTEDNLATAPTQAADKGKALNFVVKQRVPGSDNNSNVTKGNVGAGISVKPSADGWNSGTNIKMTGTGTSGSVIMSLANSASTAYLQPKAEMLRLTNTTTADDGYAVVTDNSAAEDGVTYTKTVKFTFTRENQ